MKKMDSFFELLSHMFERCLCCVNLLRSKRKKENTVSIQLSFSVKFLKVGSDVRNGRGILWGKNKVDLDYHLIHHANLGNRCDYVFSLSV